MLECHTVHTPRSQTRDRPRAVLVGYLIVLFRFLVGAVARAFGVSGEGSTLLTLIVIGSAARGVRRVFAAPRKQVRKARSSPNLAGNTMIATAAFKETVDSIAGRPSRDTRFAAGADRFRRADALLPSRGCGVARRSAEIRPRRHNSGSQTPVLVLSPGIDGCREKS